VEVMMMHLRHVLLHHHSLIVIRKRKHLIKIIKSKAEVVAQFFLLHSAYILPTRNSTMKLIVHEFSLYGTAQCESIELCKTFDGAEKS